MVASFAKGKQTVILYMKKEEGTELYWIEENGERIEADPVTSWEEAKELLNQYPWVKMNTAHVNLEYSDRIAEARENYSGKSSKKRVNSQLRILQIFMRVLHKEPINLEHLVMEYGKHVETIKKDIEYIRLALDANQQLKYDKVRKQYNLIGNEDFLTVGDSLALLLMLYHSRVLNQDECQSIVNKLIKSYSLSQQEKLRRFFRPFKAHYHPVQEHDLLEKIDILFKAILDQNIIQFKYQKNGEAIKGEVIPYTIVFHDGMFYLAAHKSDLHNEKPVYWRLDRISECKMLEDHFRLDEHIDLGEYRMQSFNMFTGELMKVKIKIKTRLLEYLKRECVMAWELEKLDDEWSLYEIEVRGTQGIILWLLQQKDKVEVLAPQELRQEMKETIDRMSKVYQS